MPIFCAAIPRAAVLLVFSLTFCLVAPETFNAHPNLCLWRRLLEVPSCPACGTLPALAAFFHGRFAEGLAFNHNAVFTAPALLVLLIIDTLRALRKVVSL